MLRGFDDDIRLMLRDELLKKGLILHANTQISAIKKTSEGYQLQLDNGQVMDTGLVMYATGRRPNSSGIGLEEVGVEIDQNNAVVVDATSKTTVENIYAIGDLTNRINLTPVALEEGMAVANTTSGLL